MSLKIYAFPPSPRSFKVLWTAHYLELDYEFVFVDLRTGAQRTPESLALNPNGRAPFIDDDGYGLWESNAIVNYLALKKPDAGLLPEDTRARLQIEKWQFWESGHWDAACAIFAFERVVKPGFGLGTESEEAIARGTQLFERIAKVLDGELMRHRYVAGDTLSVADFSVGADLSIADQARYPLAPYAGIQRWRDELQAMPSWQKTVAMQQQPAATPA